MKSPPEQHHVVCIISLRHSSTKLPDSLFHDMDTETKKRLHSLTKLAGELKGDTVEF